VGVGGQSIVRGLQVLENENDNANETALYVPENVIADLFAIGLELFNEADLSDGALAC
jgi:hypothetical protein